MKVGGQGKAFVIACPPHRNAGCSPLVHLSDF